MRLSLLLIIVGICLWGLTCSNTPRFSDKPIEQDFLETENSQLTSKQKVIVKQLKKYRKQINTNLPFAKILWEAVLPGVKIRKIDLVTDLLCIQTDAKNLYAIRTDSGLRQWQNYFAQPIDFSISEVEGIPQKLKELNNKIATGRYNLEIELGKRHRESSRIENIKRELKSAREMLKLLRIHDQLYLISRGEIFCLDRLSGNIFWRKRLDFIPGTAPTAIPRSVFIGAVDWDRTYQFDCTDQYEKNWFRADSLVSTRPICVSPYLYFASRDGNIYCYDIKSGEKKWEYKTQGNIRGDMLLDDDTLYVGSSNFALYALNRHIGKLNWKFECGSPIRAKPLIVRSSKQNLGTEADGDLERDLYFNAENNVFYALKLFKTSTKTFQGDNIIWSYYKLKWEFPSGKRLITKSGRRSYIIGIDNKTLYELDDTSGTLKAQYSLEPFVFCLGDLNTNSGIIYLASSDGYIFAVQAEN